MASSIKVGDIFSTNNSGKLRVSEYLGAKRVKVTFEKTGYSTYTQVVNIKKGQVKDPYTPSVYGVGFIGSGEHSPSINRKLTPAYMSWHRMMERCYCVKKLEEKPSYKGCTVCDEWHNFQNFAEWYSKHMPTEPEKNSLDKDILSGKQRGKVYSPETCMFVTYVENSRHANSREYLFLNPKGEVEHVTNLKEFSRNNSLNSEMMYRLNMGKIKQHRGWQKCTI